jgi:hypothetical protein
MLNRRTGRTLRLDMPLAWVCQFAGSMLTGFLALDIRAFEKQQLEPPHPQVWDVVVFTSTKVCHHEHL